jgi:hypothetical protein
MRYAPRSARQFSSNDVGGTHWARLFPVGTDEKLDDAVLFRVNEAISGGSSCELLQVLPSYSKSFNRFDVASPPGRRCCENLKRKLLLFLSVWLGFHQSLRRSVHCKQADAPPSDFVTTRFMTLQLAFLLDA